MALHYWVQGMHVGGGMEIAHPLPGQCKVVDKCVICWHS